MPESAHQGRRVVPATGTGMARPAAISRLGSLILNHQVVAGVLAASVLVLFLFPAVPALEQAIHRNAVLREANRVVTEIQIARVQALKTGSTVNLCRSLVDDACVSDLAECRCLDGTTRRQYEKGWLLYKAPDSGANFDPQRDELLSLGESAAAGVMIRGSSSMADRFSFRRDGSVDHLEGVTLAVCLGDESTPEVPGRTIRVSVSGRPEISVIPPGSYCFPEE